MNWLSAAAVFAACSALLAQSDAPLPTPTRAEQRAQSMRDHIGQGRTVQSHVRVSVRLKNGNKLQGVVKDGNLVERVDGLRFVEAQARDKGAGIRLWYTVGARSYVFLPFAEFAEYEVMQRLSDKQILEIEAELQMDERRAAERAARAAAKAAAPATGAGDSASAAPAEPQPAVAAPAAEGKPAAANQSPATKTGPESKPGSQSQDTPKEPAESTAATSPEQQRKWFALLQTYPAGDGWGPARRDEIQRRLSVVGAKPSAVELEFVAQFAEWQKAAAHFGVDGDKAAVGSEGNGVGAPPPGNERKKRRR